MKNNTMSDIMIYYEKQIRKLEAERDILKQRCEALERAISKGCRTCVKNIKNKQCDGEKCRYYDYKWWQFDEARFANGGEVNG